MAMEVPLSSELQVSGAVADLLESELKVFKL
jgi:hypothetical protein